VTKSDNFWVRPTTRILTTGYETLKAQEERETLKVIGGEVTLSNGYPVELVVDQPIPFDQYRSWQSRYSEALDMPVMFAAGYDNQNDPYNNDTGYRIEMYHPDSVLVDDAWSLMDSDRSSVPRNPKVIGLWDGESILELVRLLVEYVTARGGQYSDIAMIDVAPLRNFRLSKNELRGSGIGVQGIKSHAYFRDRKGGMLYIPYVHSFSATRGGLLLTTALSSLLAFASDDWRRSSRVLSEAENNEIPNTVFIEDHEDLERALEGFMYVAQ